MKHGPNEFWRNRTSDLSGVSRWEVRQPAAFFLSASPYLARDDTDKEGKCKIFKGLGISIGIICAGMVGLPALILAAL
jgi:hypothetical protein